MLPVIGVSAAVLGALFGFTFSELRGKQIIETPVVIEKENRTVTLAEVINQANTTKVASVQPVLEQSVVEKRLPSHFSLEGLSYISVKDAEQTVSDFLQKMNDTLSDEEKQLYAPLLLHLMSLIQLVSKEALELFLTVAAEYPADARALFDDATMEQLKNPETRSLALINIKNVSTIFEDKTELSRALKNRIMHHPMIVPLIKIGIIFGSDYPDNASINKLLQSFVVVVMAETGRLLEDSCINLYEKLQ
jgi:hypothetical protein